MKVFFYFLTVMLLFSCEKEVKEVPDQHVQAPKSDVLEFTVISEGLVPGSGAEGFVQQGILVQSQGHYDTLLARMSTYYNLKATISDTILDFNHFQVIAVFSNVKSTAGHAIEVREIKDNISDIVVYVKEESGNAGADASVMTQPYQLVKMLKSEKEVSFSWE